jgi:molybdopterin/thiamine biosynthesis adenylyltransferase
MLSDQQIERYSRQIILPQVGGRGQRTLLSASVAVVGGGDLSAAAALYLAAAGVGRLTLSEPSPLSAIVGMNPDCRVGPIPAPLTREVIAGLARNCDVIIAGGAPPEVCEGLNAACVAHGTPLVWGDAVGSLGLMTVFGRDRSECPCYDCVHTRLAQLLATGDMGNPLAEAAAALIGTLQATATIKNLLGLDRCVTTRVLRYDAVAGRLDEEPISRDPCCRTCVAT